MVFSTGDVLLDRFELQEVLRNELGFSAWKAYDASVQRPCQIFVVTNSSVLSRVNTAASYLALSQHASFTPVLHLFRERDLCIIVCAEDAGITVRDFASRASRTQTIDPNSIRSIIGEVTHAVQDLRDHNLTHYALTATTIRLSDDGVIIADFPVSSLMQPPTITAASTFTEHNQSLSQDTDAVLVRQICAVLYELLTGEIFTPDSDNAVNSLKSAYPALPTDLEIICSRGLGLIKDDGSSATPLVTLMELQILLDDSKPFVTLAHNRDDVSRETSTPSICQVVLKKAQPHQVATIPQSLISSISSPHTDRENPEWTPSELIFGGSQTVDMRSPEDHSDIFKALQSVTEPSRTPTFSPASSSRTDLDTNTHSISVQKPRVASQSTRNDAHNAQNSLPQSYEPDAKTLTQGFAQVAPRHEKPAVVGGTQTTISFESATASTDPGNVSRETLPPSFTPRATKSLTATPSQEQMKTPSHDNDISFATASFAQTLSTLTERVENAFSSRPARSSQTSQSSQSTIFSVRHFLSTHKRAISVITVIAILAGIFFLALYSLGIGKPLPNTTQDPWSEISKERVRFPGRTDSDSSSDSSSSNNTDSGKSTDSSNAQDSNAQKADQTLTTTNTKPTVSSTTETPDREIKPVKLPAEKSSQSLPEPSGIGNTQPIEIQNYSFLNRPQGLKGYGWQFRFASPQKFWRIDVGNTAPGGVGYIYADATVNDPNHGTPIGRFTFAADGQPTQIILSRPTTTQNLVIWIDASDAASIPQSIRLTSYNFY